MARPQELLLPALELRQGTAHKLYSFAVDGKLLPAFTTVSRLHQTNGNDIAGYQRPEVLSHIAEIRAYLESDNPVLPTSIVIAFDDTVTFEPAKDSPPVMGTAIPGMLSTSPHKKGVEVCGFSHRALTLGHHFGHRFG